jgi:hypothetical protein
MNIQQAFDRIEALERGFKAIIANAPQSIKSKIQSAFDGTAPTEEKTQETETILPEKE